MLRLVEQVKTIAASDAPVLVVGESGTGKELVARELHELSSRARAPFVAINCAAFPETLLEAELFGYERGAFSGATRRRDGRFQSADGGTLLLDEVAEMPLPAQAKLLRVLQEGVVEPLGTDRPVQVDVRIVSATHRNLRQRIAEGSFREDLYYRLKVLDVEIPPLRERPGDLPVYVEHFLRRFAGPDRPLPTLSGRVWSALETYPFPGNVRELAHVLERAVVLAHGSDIDVEHLPAELLGAGASSGSEWLPLGLAMKRFEREYLLRALSAAGSKREAALLLGVTRKCLWEKLRMHGITPAEVDRPRGR